jgi:flavin-dependent dehydrogenase
MHVRDLLHDRGSVIGVRGGDATTAVTIRARAVIGADGYGSRIARAVRGEATARAGQVGVALRAYATDFSLPAAWRDCLVFAFDEQTAPGYGWLMPLPDGTANVGIGTIAPAGDVPDTHHLRDLFARFMAGTPWLAGTHITTELPPRTWPLALAPRSGPLVADGVLLVGEAAALVGPMTGAGIYPALRSGVWAGETLIAALRAGDISRRALLPYEQRVRRRFLPQHRAEAWAQRLLTNPTRLRRLVNAVRPLPIAAPLGASLLLHLG